VSGADRIAAAMARASAAGQPAISAFLTAGFPSLESFSPLLKQLARCADLIEIGVPFSDPMADGVTIQRASREAIARGASVRWILDQLAASSRDDTPLLLMSYLNPLLAFGWDQLCEQAASVGVAGLIIPDLPLEEQAAYRPALERCGLASIQLVTPVTSDARLAQLAARSGGFVYAVTVTGITGGSVTRGRAVTEYLQRVKQHSPVPVLAGFGVRSAEDVRRLVPPADGVIVGSALIEQLERGADPALLLDSLRSREERS
jgi:tryptophan synthase alpha chain